MKSKTLAIWEALLAAVFYAVNMPASKALLQGLGPAMLAGLLYLGAGAGVGLLSLAARGRAKPAERLSRADWPYALGMIALDIVAPVCLMLGLTRTSSAGASLLNNFEIVATAVIALAAFHEAISPRLWAAIALVTLASGLLSFEGGSSLRPSWGALLVLLAAVCWGLENNCTRKIAAKDTFQIVTLKGLCSGLGSVLVGLAAGERLPGAGQCALALLLGFVAYGLSIFFYIRAQSVLGAARTSAYYAAAPFVGALLSLLVLREPLSARFFAALGVMLLGSALIVSDTLRVYHTHPHTHVVTPGNGPAYAYEHTHPHAHAGDESAHDHRHPRWLTRP